MREGKERKNEKQAWKKPSVSEVPIGTLSLCTHIGYSQVSGIICVSCNERGAECSRQLQSILGNSSFCQLTGMWYDF